MFDEQSHRAEQAEEAREQPGKEGRAKARSDGLREAVEQATKLLAFGAVALVVLFAFRALRVANMDIHVATALVTQTPLTAAFQTMALTLVPSLAYAGAATLFYVCPPRFFAAFAQLFPDKQSVPRRPQLRAFNALAWSALGIVTGGLLLWSYILRLPGSSSASLIPQVLSLTPIVAILFLRLSDTWKRAWMRALPAQLLIVTAVVTAYSLIFSLSSSSMWLPPEQITTNKGDFVMYVLNSDNDRLVAFVPANRAVIQIASSEVQTRQFCSPNIQLTVAWSILGQPVMQSCFYEEDDKYPVDIPTVTSDQLPLEPPDRLP